MRQWLAEKIARATDVFEVRREHVKKWEWLFKTYPLPRRLWHQHLYWWLQAVSAVAHSLRVDIRLASRAQYARAMGVLTGGDHYDRFRDNCVSRACTLTREMHKIKAEDEADAAKLATILSELNQNPNFVTSKPTRH